jgi:hypothetical protein
MLRMLIIFLAVCQLFLSATFAGYPTLQQPRPTATIMLTQSSVKTPTPTPRSSPTPTGLAFYVSPNGSPSGNGSITKPWNLQTALNQRSSVVGATIYLRGGTYTGKFSSNLRGLPTLPIVVQSYPGEWAKIDGYTTATLNGAIDPSTATIVLADAANFPSGSEVSIADQSDPSSEEQIQLNNRSGNTFTGCSRGWNGTRPRSHSNGAVVVLGGNQLTINGDYTVWEDLEIKNSDPVRIQATPNAQNAPHLRGEGLFNVGKFNKFINCIIHDVQDGFFNSQRASGTLLYGNLIFNNGYVAARAFNGHGIYFIHEDLSNTAYIKENIVFNNSSIGLHGDSQNVNSRNIWSEGNVTFNSGSWSQRSSRSFNILMASNNGIADIITLKDNFMWHPFGVNGSNLVVGLGGAQNGSVTITGNYVAGGIPLTVNNWTRVTVSGNTFYGANNTGGGNSTMVLYLGATQSIANWNSNVSYNLIAGATGYFSGAGSDSSTFSQWKHATGFDANSTERTTVPGSNASFVRPNAYDANQANIVVYNWTGGSSVAVNLSGVLAPGDSYSVYAAENILGAPVASGTFSGGTVNIPINGNVVAQPVGWRATIASMRPAFGAFRLWKGTRPF